jgi:hypothetical protein
MAIENAPFINDFPMKPALIVYRCLWGTVFSITMVDYRRACYPLTNWDAPPSRGQPN